MKYKTEDASKIMEETQLANVSLGIDSKSLKEPRYDLAGLRVKLPNKPDIYLILPDGCKHHIPNSNTYNNLFKDWNNIVIDLDIDEIPTGIPISNGAVLTRGNQTGSVFLVTNNCKRHITSPKMMEKYSFDWAKVYIIPQIIVDNIPTGNTI